MVRLAAFSPLWDPRGVENTTAALMDPDLWSVSLSLHQTRDRPAVYSLCERGSGADASSANGSPYNQGA